MGQIVIDIPTQKKRRYVLNDTKRVEELLTSLESSATRVKSSAGKLTPRQIDDLKDFLDAKAALDEMNENDLRYSVEDLRNEFGL